MRRDRGTPDIVRSDPRVLEAYLGVADIGCVLDLGTVHITGPARELLAEPQLSDLYLGGRPGENKSAVQGSGSR